MEVGKITLDGCRSVGGKFDENENSCRLSAQDVDANREMLELLLTR